MIYFVTGGAGYIGSYVVRDLLKEGHEVLCYDLQSEPTPLMHELIKKDDFKRLKFVKGDIADFNLISDTIRKQQPEKIIHFSSILPPISETDVPFAIKTNVIGTQNIFEAAHTFGIKRVVWSSSCASISKLGEVFNTNLLDSTDIYGTKNFYGATKIICELMAKQYIKNYGLEIITLRYPVVYGIGKSTGWGAYFANMMKNAALGNTATIRGGDSNWPYMYVEDVSMTTIKASQVPLPDRKVFNLQQGGYYNGWQLAEILKELNPKAIINVEPGKDADYDLPLVTESTFQKELQFTPRYSLKEGFRLVINYYRKQNRLPMI
jgi:UDP-glucose 4-epimerase